MSYYRPATTTRAELVVAKSRFIATIGYANLVDEARAFINQIKLELPNANHYVYAFRVGYGNSVTEGMSDDGEPSGTSGPPSLAVLRGQPIGDIVLVTARYFGGTKLGTGGLVRAYTEVAQNALAVLPTQLEQPLTQCSLRLPYTLYQPIKELVSRDVLSLTEVFESDVQILFTLPSHKIPELEYAIQELSAGKVQLIHAPAD